VYNRVCVCVCVHASGVCEMNGGQKGGEFEEGTTSIMHIIDQGDEQLDTGCTAVL